MIDAAKLDKIRLLCLTEAIAALKEIGENSTSLRSKSLARTALWSMEYIVAHEKVPTQQEMQEPCGYIFDRLRSGEDVK